LKERILTGAFLVALLLLITYFHNFWLIWAFLGLIYIVSIHEVKKLYQLRPNVNYFLIAILIWGVSASMENPSHLGLVVFAIFLGTIAYKPNFEKAHFYPYLYPTIPILAIWEIYKFHDFTLLGWLIVIVALTDTMAYFVGRAIGKRPFSPTSPKKTLEGVFGGIAFATVGGVALGIALFDYSILQLIAFSLIISISSIFGDLFESFLKRSAGVKDSGDILPGHGGVLDRLDGYLLSAPLLLVLLQW
jgi:phosphatidate cytidylyltransferase